MTWRVKCKTCGEEEGLSKRQLAFCLVCNECLGEAHPCFAKAHLQKFPDHKLYFVKTIRDPLKLSDSELSDYVSHGAYQPVLDTQFGHHHSWIV